MLVKVNEYYGIRIESSSFNPFVIKTTKEGKNKGDTREETLGYCSTVGRALQLIIMDMSSKAEDTSIEGLKKIYEDFVALEIKIVNKKL